MSFEEFQQEMIREAKVIQGDDYIGDKYYLQDCWRDDWRDGETAKDAVNMDMSYWDDV